MPYDSKAKMAALDEAEDAAEGALGGHLRARVKKSKEANIEAPAPPEGAATEVAELKPLLEQLIELLGGEAAGGMMPEGGGMMGKGGMMGGGSMMGG